MKWLLPPLLWIMMILSAFALKFLVPSSALMPWPWWMIGILPILLGVLITVSASRQFNAVETNIKTFDDPDILVVEGWFRVSRNPMYLGFFLTLLGLGIVLNSPLSLGPAIVFFLACQFWYIPFEERAAQTQFGEAFDQYKAQVRRWV